jgi:hypothetical protein
MFQMNPGALEVDVQRRRELAFATMRAAHGTLTTGGRVNGVARIRHVVLTLASVVAQLA